MGLKLIIALRKQEKMFPPIIKVRETIQKQ